MKCFILIVFIAMFSCGNKEDILLPKSNITLVANVQDHSPIYIFFRIKGKDTLAEVNRKNSIISTNWILNIDKRLPLCFVIPEVIKLQKKKREDKAHKNDKAENYFAYADSIGKNMAFLPFTKVYYKMEKPQFGMIVFFAKNNTISVNNTAVKKEELQNYLDNSSSDKPVKFLFCFAKDLSFGNYLQNKIFIQSLKFSTPNFKLTNQEFVY